MHEKPPPILLSVVQAGTPEHPRFKVMDSWTRFWDGEKWSDDEAAGLLYATSNDACLEAQRLLMIPYMDKPLRRYKAPVYIDLFSDHEIPRPDLIRWLVRCSKLLLDHNTHGVGPASGTLGSVSIEWSGIEQVKD